MAAAAYLSLAFLAGCDERVQITRDHDVHIPRHATWAWRPAVEEATARPSRDDRRVTSRDVISPRDAAPPRERVVRDANADDALVRQRVKTAIEQTLASKGFQQVDTPEGADFLVDYKFAVERHSAAVPVAYPGAYPGLVCGPFRCWESWGYGPGYAGYENIHFREGMIVFDFVEQANKHLVYRAIGEKPVRGDALSLTQGDINGLTHHLLQDLKSGK